ncbi:ATP-binding protein [Hymenobacter convexus]|uniref:ATP-binding protein n=1 Tax=Hymenobacter sp. CA1UV-4 TaxID=3063782 RepID=UPI002714030C|nr:ATP-binding protein [Hymenobacter sp. CA1UV-4]MDO7853589.1 ATP-binding protein [Hymenobacter sp. CA1UV-4]
MDFIKNPPLIVAPKNFSISATDKFLKDCEFMFTIVGKYIPGGVIQLGYIENINLVNVLILYKLMSFCGENRCILNTEIIADDPIIIQFRKYGLYPLLLSYVGNVSQVEREYKHLGVISDENFLIAPQALLRKDMYSHETIRTKYLPAIEDYYQHNKKGGLMILTCLSEILLNFWEHAVEDDRTVIVAYGTKDRIEIACADNGDGILTTLSRTYPNVKSKKDLIMSSIKKGVTSKKLTNHMGYGLWLINEITTRVGGRLHIFSEGGHIQNEYGKIKYFDSGNWSGTIIYLDLPLKSPVTISDIEGSIIKNSSQQLQINWV